MQQTKQDQSSRDQIADSLDQNFLVEASAGTGKTTSIVMRMVNLVARGKCEIGQLVAVTFTHKAAAELRERFHVGLQVALGDEKRPAEERERLQVASRQVDRVFVGTFHAFCSVLLHERPIEAGVDPGFRGMEDQETCECRDRAWQTFLADLHVTNDGRLARLHELGLQPDKVQAAYNRFVEFPDIEAWPTAENASVDFDQVREFVEAYIAQIQCLPEFPADRGNDQLMDHYEAILRRAANRSLDNKAELMEVLYEFSRNRKVVQKNWPDKKIGKEARDFYAQFRAEVALPRLEEWYAVRYAFLIGLLRDAAAVFEAEREQSGGLSFNDLLLKTSAALRENSHLREYFQTRFTHLLVDEFQDTDPIQAEILAFLSGDDQQQTDWTQCRPRPGALFLVGDPKQSIFRFRRADIVTYNQMKELLVSAGGKVLPLRNNFRTVKEVRNWGNDVFNQLLGKASKYSPAASPMEQGRDDATADGLRGVHVLTVPDEYSNVDNAVAYEAEAIARYIAGCIAIRQPVPRTQSQLDLGQSPDAEPGDFMIVTPSKSRLHIYAAALDRLGVPNTVSGSNPFVEIKELDFLLNCLRAVDDSKNPIPYVALLRGASLGFSDADLFALKKCGGRFSYESPLPDDLEASLAERYRAVNLRLVKFRNWLRGLPFPSAIERILHDLGLLVRAVSRKDGNVAAGALLKAVELLRKASCEFDSAVDVITYLENLSEASEVEGCTVLPPQTSHVRVMNIHKAKGLEAPVVFLACPTGKIFPPHFHVDRDTKPSRGFFVMSEVRPGKTRFRSVEIMIARPSGWDDFKAEEERFKAAERLRLLYVAVTRAGSQLVVTQRPNNNTKHLWAPLDPYLTDAAALEIPASSDAIAPEIPTALEDDFETTKTRLDEHWRSATQPTYGVTAAKSFALSGVDRPDWQIRGGRHYGENWGSAIHELLESVGRKPDQNLRSLSLRLCDVYDLAPKRAEEMVETVESVIQSEIWKRAQASAQVLYEVPFELPLSAETEQSAAGGGATLQVAVPTIVKGVIDLVFRDDGGWVIVDYKTDAVSPRDVSPAAKYYQHQLKSYAEFWQTMTEEPVVETGLYFTRLNQYHPCV